ncbi:MAG: LPS assembly protein LptD [Gammaproteobacteria bacterium]|nr:LPS assembly protein LptD [Gammaproteobacteria bacterium]
MPTYTPAQPHQLNRLIGLHCVLNKALLLFSCLFFGSFSSLALAEHRPLNLDWQSAKATITNYCPGYYLPYLPPALDQDLPADEQPLYSDADSSEYEQGVTHLRGNVELRQGQRTMTGDYARFDNNQRYIEMTGHVQFRRPNMLAQSDDAHFDMANSEARLNNAQLVLPNDELRSKAETIDYHQDETITMNDGYFTYCPPGNDGWRIESSKIDLDPKQGFGEAQHAILKLGSVPVFYLPWMSFPIDDQRRSGFLFPTVSSSTTMGLDVSTPYYLNLAPNYDALITPRFTEFRGTSLGAKIRHLGQDSEQDLQINWAIEDPSTPNNRWLMDYNHKAKISPNLSSSIHVKRVSDVDVLSDYNAGQTSSSIVSNGTLNYQGKNPLLSKASVSLITHQNLTTSVPAYDQLPHASISGGATSSLDKDAIKANYAIHFSRFTRDTEGLTGADKITGMRTHLLPSLSSAWVNDYSFVKPKISLPITRYQLSDTPATIAASKTRIIPQLEIDSGLLFERDLPGGYLQTLEPRLYYAYTPYKQQDDITNFDTSLNSKPFYTLNRFSGQDRIGDTNRITLGLDSQFLNARGWQKAKLSVTQIHYLSDRKVHLSSSTAATTETFSPIYGHMSYQFSPHWSSSLNIDWSPQSGNVEATSASMKYQMGKNKIIDVKYTETLNSTQQGEISMIWPIAPQWTFVAKHKEDIRNQQLQDEVVGIEYANCCWKGRLVNRYWLVDQAKGIEHGIFFEISLKGLGNRDKQLTSGNKVRMADFMKGITGYNEYTQ